MGDDGLEELRRRLYRAGADAEDLRRYRELRNAEDEEDAAPSTRARPRRPSRRSVLIALVPVAAVVAATALLAGSARRPSAVVPSATPTPFVAMTVGLAPPALTGEDAALRSSALGEFADGGPALGRLEDRLVAIAFPEVGTDVDRDSAGETVQGSSGDRIPVRGFSPRRGDRFVVTVISEAPVTVHCIVDGRLHGSAHRGIVLLATSRSRTRVQVASGDVPLDVDVDGIAVAVAPTAGFRYRVTLLRTGSDAGAP